MWLYYDVRLAFLATSRAYVHFLLPFRVQFFQLDVAQDTASRDVYRIVSARAQEGCGVFANCSLSHRVASLAFPTCATRTHIHTCVHARVVIFAKHTRVFRGSRVMRVRGQFTRGKDGGGVRRVLFRAEMQRQGDSIYPCQVSN